MEVICDHAKIRCGECAHNSPHEELSLDTCSTGTCGVTGETVCCIPVSTKKDQDDLLVRLKDQMVKTETAQYKNEVDIAERVLENQMVIMEALVALLEGR